MIEAFFSIILSVIVLPLPKTFMDWEIASTRKRVENFLKVEKDGSGLCKMKGQRRADAGHKKIHLTASVRLQKRNTVLLSNFTPNSWMMMLLEEEVSVIPFFYFCFLLVYAVKRKEGIYFNLRKTKTFRIAFS